MTKPDTNATREQKLANKLRENLRRRKAQTNLRRANLHKEPKTSKTESDPLPEPDHTKGE